jgi:DNA-binding NarL/FixJ family response regulator
MNLILLIHDYDPVELAGTEALLTRNPTIAAWDRITTSSRNKLLNTISDLDSNSRGVALIDLCAQDGTDHEFRGVRIIETIRRHPRLSARAHPIALTRHARGDVILDLQQAGAALVIHKRALEQPDTSPVANALTDLTGTLPTAWGARSSLLTVPETSDLAVTGEDERTVWKSLFGDLRYSSQRRAILLARLNGTANADLATRMFMSVKTVEKHVREMHDHLAPRHQRGQIPSLIPAAEELLARCVQLGPLPADLARLPSPSRVRAWYDDPVIRRGAWLDPDTDQTIKKELSDPPDSWRETKVDARTVTRAVLALLDAADDYEP